MKIWFDIQDLYDIRAMAQRYLKQGLFKSNYKAMRAARKAVIKMKRYFKA